MTGRDVPGLVLFDLDGTLADTAPDLIHAIARLCAELGAPAPVTEMLRHSVSAGGRALLRLALPGAGAERIEALLPRFLALYAEDIAVHTRLYPGIADLIDDLDARRIPWGIVTNKPGALTRMLLAELALGTRCAALVCGDSLPVRKPDPATVLHACELAGVPPERTVLVGDDLRDVLAGRAAGSRTIAAAWGYLDGGDPAQWGADQVIALPQDLPRALGLGQ
jgi:phosphoglycolate phosphatase